MRKKIGGVKKIWNEKFVEEKILGASVTIFGGPLQNYWEAIGFRLKPIGPEGFDLGTSM